MFIFTDYDYGLLWNCENVIDVNSTEQCLKIFDDKSTLVQPNNSPDSYMNGSDN